MVYTGYLSNGLQNAEDTEWLPYGDPNEWAHGLAAYDGLELMGGNEQEVQPSLNRVMKNIDYDLALKHPLEHTWTLWHLENDRTKRWAEMLVDVTSFNTVEDFFSVYYFVKPPSDLKIFNDYMVFKKNIRPMWEDDTNKNGGRWILLLDKASRTYIDKMWHDLILCMIGECFEHSDEICGVVINVRNKANKLSLWTKDSRNVEAILSIGRQIKDLLHLGIMEIQYQVHNDAMLNHGPNVHAIYKL